MHVFVSSVSEIKVYRPTNIGHIGCPAILLPSFFSVHAFG